MNQYAPDALEQVFDALDKVLSEIDRNIKLLNRRVAALEAWAIRTGGAYVPPEEK